MVGAHFFGPSFELLDDLVGGTDGDEERFVDVLETESAVKLVGQSRALFQLIDREIAGRSEECRRGAQRILEEITDVVDRFFLSLFFGLRDVGDHLQRKLLRADVVAVLGRAPAQLLVELGRPVFGDEHRRIAEAEFGREFDRFRTSGAHDVAGGCGF